ncbi:uncharacterized protein ACUXCC_004207 [Cytobacillus horneckiae]|uniref:Alpha/beta hydrolase n=1 Tax=Cytobacillus horneckiae TaxID=549687 RepID=A0A2N0ZHY6_9BACI|nr:alpha/beta hydrolase [Cytobacillus horneckiae]MBN6886902.1 alpha/beta hydrolase [Cytobacillus horneckiae]MCM3177628.1 alpha/beta hydrolase [Cytobacillus horneckiae]MEC1157933.1 alpha/beta hydrolase [Cytobacillus horneckiae]MED2937142.1 alpha/beta hydrolase [Cytobacillus horneckiae]PKG29118.1 alpha/beta hydrolase [Cytobacillus horneckiae]
MKKFVLVIIFTSLFALFGGCSNNDKEEELVPVNNEIAGAWEGSIDIPQSPLPIILKLEEGGGSLSVPVQNMHDYPFSNVVYNGNEANINIDLSGSQITIKLAYDNGKLQGTFTQNGGSFPLELTRHEKEEVTYSEIEVEVDGGKLKAALELPEKDGPYPVSIIVAGSGPTDKNGNTIGAPGKNDSLKMLAESLASEGIASIRFDKRGIGENAQLSVKEEDLRFENLISDVEQLIKFASTDEQFTSVNVIGHSEGSLIGMVAAQNQRADRFISIAGPARSADLILQDQLKEQLPPELMIETEEIIAKLVKGDTVNDVSNELQALFRPSVQPYLISWFSYEPKSTIKELNMDVLIINGTNDLQVPQSEAVMLKQAKSNAEIVIIDEMNHVLKQAPRDREENLATYFNPELPLMPEFVSSITDFLLR